MKIDIFRSYIATIAGLITMSMAALSHYKVLSHYNILPDAPNFWHNLVVFIIGAILFFFNPEQIRQKITKFFDKNVEEQNFIK